MQSSATDAVGMVLVIDELVLEAEVLFGVGQIVFHTAITDGSDLPFPCKLEVLERLDR